MKRLAIEAFAIVASILLAFAIDAWWEERQERAAETDELSRLRTEFVDNVMMIDERSYESEILSASVDVFRSIEAAQSRGDSEAVIHATDLVLMLAAPTFDADTPILNGLIRSGRLQIIEDRPVLSALADWDRLLRDYISFAERARRSVDSRLLPALTVRADIGSILMIPTTANRIDPERYGEMMIPVKIDDELKGLVAERWRNGSYAVRLLGDARNTAALVVDAIDAAGRR